MDDNLRLARQHCQWLLAENIALDSNLAVLWGVISMFSECAQLEGRDVGEIAFGPELPTEVIQANIHALGQRLQALRAQQPAPPAPNGHEGKRVPVGAGKEKTNAS